jgi:hypothetical protein
MFAAAAVSLTLIGMDPNMAGAIDRTTLRHQGDEAFADLITITGDPNGADGLGRLAVSHMRFDCKGSRMTLASGFSQPQSGDRLMEVETHDWAAVPPQSPAWATFQLACFDKGLQPAATFTSYQALLDYYDQALKRGGPPDAPRQ